MRTQLAAELNAYEALNLNHGAGQKPASAANMVESRWRNLIASAMDAIVVVDSDQCITLMNAAAERMFGLEEQKVLGSSFGKLLPPRDRPAFDSFIRAKSIEPQSAADEGPLSTPAPQIIKCMKHTGQEFDAEVSRSWHSADHQCEVTVILRDITARQLAERVNAQQAAIVTTSADAIISISAHGIVETWNRSAERLLGFSQQEAVGHPLQLILPIRDCPVSRARFSEQTQRMECLVSTKNGAMLPVEITATPMRSPDGRVIGLSAIMIDISERKKRDEQIRFIMMELSHRDKNLMAVVLSMAQSTASTCETLADFDERFSARVRCLSYSHDLLLQQEWIGARLDSIIETQLAPFANLGWTRYSKNGPNVVLNPKAAQMVGLALHELATNASKYGAFSLPTGLISIDWRIDETNGSPGNLVVEWRETGGPAVAPPSRKGFGHMVIADMITRTLNASVEFDYNPAGIVWRVEAPPGTWSED